LIGGNHLDTPMRDTLQVLVVLVLSKCFVLEWCFSKPRNIEEEIFRRKGKRGERGRKRKLWLLPILLKL
jgi:hypothetical protein